MSIIWAIEQMERQTADGLVTTVHWRATAQDGDDVATAYGSVGLERGNSFIEYTSGYVNGGAGGTGASGTLNMSGQGGGMAFVDNITSGVYVPGLGGSSVFGGGGNSIGGGVAGGSGGAYGGGGGGAYAANGGSGAAGVIIFEY